MIIINIFHFYFVFHALLLVTDSCDLTLHNLCVVGEKIIGHVTDHAHLDIVVEKSRPTDYLFHAHSKNVLPQGSLEEERFLK